MQCTNLHGDLQTGWTDSEDILSHINQKQTDINTLASQRILMLASTLTPNTYATLCVLLEVCPLFHTTFPNFLECAHGRLHFRMLASVNTLCALVHTKVLSAEVCDTPKESANERYNLVLRQ